MYLPIWLLLFCFLFWVSHCPTLNTASSKRHNKKNILTFFTLSRSPTILLVCLCNTSSSYLDWVTLSHTDIGLLFGFLECYYLYGYFYFVFFFGCPIVPHSELLLIQGHNKKNILIFFTLSQSPTILLVWLCNTWSSYLNWVALSHTDIGLLFGFL